MPGSRARLAETAEQMDRIVENIFATMMGCSCVPMAAGQQPAADIHASVTFAQGCCRACEVALRHCDADALMRSLVGDVDEKLRADMAGELCNMIAGGWMDFSGVERNTLVMQPPRIGPARRMEPGDGRSFRGTYSFGSGCFTVQLRCLDAH